MNEYILAVLLYNVCAAQYLTRFTETEQSYPLTRPLRSSTYISFINYQPTADTDKQSRSSAVWNSVPVDVR